MLLLFPNKEPTGLPSRKTEIRQITLNESRPWFHVPGSSRKTHWTRDADRLVLVCVSWTTSLVEGSASAMQARLREIDLRTMDKEAILQEVERDIEVGVSEEELKSSLGVVLGHKRRIDELRASGDLPVAFKRCKFEHRLELVPGVLASLRPGFVRRHNVFSHVLWVPDPIPTTVPSEVLTRENAVTLTLPIVPKPRVFLYWVGTEAQLSTFVTVPKWEKVGVSRLALGHGTQFAVHKDTKWFVSKHGFWRKTGKEAMEKLPGPPLGLSDEFLVAVSSKGLHVLSGDRRIPQQQFCFQSNKWLVADKEKARNASYIVHRGTSATFFDDTKLLVTGGKVFAERMAHTFDLFTNERSALPGMLEARAQHCCVGLPDGRVMVLGGNGNSGHKLRSCEFFDGIGWTEAPSLLHPRANFATFVERSHLIVFGGHRTTELLDLRNLNQGWVSLGRLEMPSGSVIAPCPGSSA